MDRDNREGRSAAAGGSGGGTQDRWTEEDFKQRVRERLDRLEQHQDRIDQRLDRIEGHGGEPSASPDKWVVDGYPLRYETTHLRASFD